ncbi:hypothetical protein DAPPUDRAFT_334244 [Daphnia pulex]|uniref:Uncharacterized protein n=1 Tax=Daphnia pulex TaxID=6669 RepID=E9HV36_DAPPU|nr:hypothetical protein DAPPUDRAFT_334244 [Daphnia pulex]|eukprot:EFX64396.1 hypothetical protein DAPPUDRAFT_334244 [Daphnia pulex]
MVHTKAGKKLMESIAAKEDRDTVRSLRAVYVRDFDLLEKRHDRYVQCKAPNYSQDDLDGEKDWIQAVIYDHLAILAKCDDYLALTNSRSASVVSRASSRHSSVSSRQAKIHEAERKEKEAELMLQQVEDETRRRKEEDAKIREAEDYKRKVESERKQREIRDEIDLQRLSGAIMRQQLNDLTVDDQAVPTRASSLSTISDWNKARKVESNESTASEDMEIYEGDDINLDKNIEMQDNECNVKNDELFSGLHRLLLPKDSQLPPTTFLFKKCFPKSNIETKYFCPSCHEPIMEENQVINCPCSGVEEQTKSDLGLNGCFYQYMSVADQLKFILESFGLGNHIKCIEGNNN